MRKHLITFCTSIILTGMPLNTALAASPNNLKQKDCPYKKLYRDASKEARHSILTPKDEPLFLSKHYCFGYVNHSKVDQRTLPGYFPDTTAMKLNRRYSKAYEALDTNEQRVAFVHLFLKQLTRKVLVIPVTARTVDKQIKVILTMSSPTPDSTSLYGLTITPKDHPKVHDGLMALPEQPKMAEKWPELAKLVDQIINPKA